MNAPVRFADPAQPRHDWTREEIEALFDLPFTELVFQAAGVHRSYQVFGALLGRRGFFRPQMRLEPSQGAVG